MTLIFQRWQKKCVTNQSNIIYKQLLNEISIESLGLRLHEFKWDNLKTSNDSNVACNEFLDTFTSVYYKCFPRMKTKMKARKLCITWITKGIAKSSRKKTKTMRKMFEKLPSSKLSMYKTYKILFETMEKKTRTIVTQKKYSKL